MRRDPGHGAIQARGRRRELVGSDLLAGGCSQDRETVVAGMGIHSDDERASMRDDGHGGSYFLPRQD